MLYRTLISIPALILSILIAPIWNQNLLAEVTTAETNGNYVVSNIIVFGDAANRDEAMENAVRSAKRIALDSMKVSIEHEQHIIINDVTLDAIDISFMLKDFEFSDNQYKGEFEISIDKKEIRSVISDYKMSHTNNSGPRIVARIMMKGNLKIFTRIRDRLDQLSIDYSIQSISYNYADIMFVDINVYDLNKKLSKDGFSILYKDGMYIIDRLW